MLISQYYGNKDIKGEDLLWTRRYLINLYSKFQIHDEDIHLFYWDFRLEMAIEAHFQVLVLKQIQKIHPTDQHHLLWSPEPEYKNRSIFISINCIVKSVLWDINLLFSNILSKIHN